MKTLHAFTNSERRVMFIEIVIGAAVVQLTTN